MANPNWLNEYDKLTPEERLDRIANILSEGVLSLIRKNNQKSREDDKKDIDMMSHLCL